MSIDIRKILFPTDLSDSSRQAFKHVAAMANRYRAGIVILHVSEGLTEKFRKRIVSFMGQAAWEQIKSDRERDVRGILINKRTERQVLGQVLSQAAEAMQTEGERDAADSDEIVVGEGNVTESILATASEKKCDLIAMAAQGETILGSSGPGGITRAVLKRARIPVLVIPGVGESVDRISGL